MIKTLLILYINRWKQQRGSMALTTLSIALSLITLSIISFHYSRLASPIYPEYNKDSARYLKQTVVYNNDGIKRSGGMILGLNRKVEDAVDGVAEIIKFSREIDRECWINNRISKIGCREVSANIFNYLQFEFITGKPFLDSDVIDRTYIPSGSLYITSIPTVITDKLSMDMFGTVESVGEYIKFPGRPEFKVCGVVKEAPNLATFSADCYYQRYMTRLPNLLFISEDNTTTEQLNNRFQKIANEENDREREENSKTQHSLTTKGNLENGLEPLFFYINRQHGYIWLLLAIAIFIFIPIICLYNILSSSLKYRISELGIRRSFGASRRDTIVRLIAENIISVLIGGVGGIILSLIVIMMLYDLTLTDVLSIYLQWRMILTTTLMFLLVGTVSGFIPAYRVSKQTIVSSINNR